MGNIILFCKREWFHLLILLVMVVFLFQAAKINSELRLLNKTLNDLHVNAQIGGSIDTRMR